MGLSSQRCCYLFGIILVVCHITDAKSFWEKFEENFAYNNLHQSRIISKNPELTNNENIFNRALLLLQNALGNLGDKRLSDFGILQPETAAVRQDPVEEYDIENLRKYVQENEAKLTPDQRAV